MPPAPAPTTRTMRFGELDVAFDERVLTPREWTLAQSDWAAELLPTLPDGRVLELCSGAGHIGLHAVLHTSRDLVCVDADEAACDFTRTNAAAAGLAHRVEVRHGAIDEVLAADERFPLVVADPPWVPTDGVGAFPEDPVHAIDGGADGLGLVRSCLDAARDHLLPDGVVLLQVGPGQEDAVGPEAVARGLVTTEIRRAGERGSLLRLDLAEETP